MICSTWFDKPLSVAGRLLVKDGNELKTQLINIDRDLVLIPNMAIHMNRAIMMVMHIINKLICFLYLAELIVNQVTL